MTSIGHQNHAENYPDDLHVHNVSTVKERDGCCRKVTNKINQSLENIFSNIGFTVATHPWKTIIISIFTVFLCLIGISQYEVENRGEKLWVSQSSIALKHKDWVEANFPSQFRIANVMIEDVNNNGGNILTKQGLKEMLKVYDNVLKVADGKPGIQWDDICYRLSNSCVPNSILELWRYNATIIDSLISIQIIDAINQKNLISPMTKKPLKASLLLGGSVVKDANGTIKKASVAKMNFKIKKQNVFDSKKGKSVDVKGEKWEEMYEKKMSEGTTRSKLYYFTEWGRQEASSNASQGDLQFFVVGYILVIIYLAIMLGSFSRINHKIYLAAGGISVIGLSVGVAYGLGSAFQMKKTGVHDVLAFLLLGIGVDDVFVIVQNWDNIGGHISDGRSIPDKISLTLRHAGVSILVTSVTDACAFLIGASTNLPALRSFCIWCGVGILSVFVLTITFFTACLTLDAQRQEKRRDACCCCITISDSWEPSTCSKKNFLQLFMKNYYAPYLLSVPGKIIGLLVLLSLLAGGAVGLASLKQDFDFNWFLPPSTSARQYTDNVDIFFPDNGKLSAAYTGRMDYYNDHAAMDLIYSKLENDQYVAKGSAESWYQQYHVWLNETYANELSVNQNCLRSYTACKLANETRFYELLHVFLKNEGRFYNNLISFTADRKHIIASSIPYQHIALTGAAAEIKAMDSIKSDIKAGSTTTEKNKEFLPFVYTYPYIGWETNRVISKELFRNVLLATLCVFIVTLFLLSHLWTALLVVACVALALVDIAGYMHFWDLTIDTVTTIIMVLAIGLTVDYSAHIAHGFMVSRKDNRNERMTEALVEIGPAVIHGGVSTLLAFLLLVASESYVFFTFFKVFFLVVSFGMFHGLVFLPIILSLIGPSPYAVHVDKKVGSATVGYSTNKQVDPVSLEKIKKKEQNPTYMTSEGRQTNKAFIPD